tara:strand:+ start:6975 stop:7379 length:405 start_codon:yes stop_codon:yes gene_type:complete
MQVWLSSNPAAIHLLKQNPEKINWCNLSKNPAAIRLLEENPEKIYWYYLSENPAIFSLDKCALRNRLYTPTECGGIALWEEFAMRLFHPNRIKRDIREFNYCLAEHIYLYISTSEYTENRKRSRHDGDGDDGGY